MFENMFKNKKARQWSILNKKGQKNAIVPINVISLKWYQHVLTFFFNTPNVANLGFRQI